jgi:hypothetical protein
MVATRSVGLERHGGIRIRTGGAVLSHRTWATNLPIRATTPLSGPIPDIGAQLDKARGANVNGTA